MNNYQKVRKKAQQRVSFAALCSALLLAGCGGGGSEDTGASPATPGTLPPASPPVITSTSEIVVPDNYAFTDQNELNVNAGFPEEVYLSVCNPLEESTAANPEIDYDRCLLRGWVRDSDYSAEIRISPHIDQLVAAVLLPGEPAETRIYKWQRENGYDWVIR